MYYFSLVTADILSINVVSASLMLTSIRVTLKGDNLQATVVYRMRALLSWPSYIIET